MNRIINYLKSVPKHIWILGVIIAIGIFFRTYNFSDWMLFREDSFRDANLVSKAVLNGPQELPFLGPRAGGTQLHLGPIFYYFQYISGTIFRSTVPPVLAYPDLLFSILAIPLFFFFLKRYFSIKMSLVMSAMLATCFMAVEYGRFAWNPNSIPFFTLLFLQALLKIYDCRGNSCRKKYFWLAISGTSLAVASQLHFAVFIGLPAVLIFFIILNWKKTKEIFSWKTVFAFFATIVVLYIPVIISELLTKGENSLLFFEVASKKPSENGFFEKIFMDIKMFSKYFLLILTGIVEGKWWQEFMAGTVFIFGIVANCFLIKNEKDESKRRFLGLIFIQVAVFFALYFLLAFEIDRPRFFLPIIAIPFIMLSLIILAVRKIGIRNKLNIIAGILVSLVIIGNVSSVTAWFYDMRESESEEMVQKRELTKKYKSYWWTWGRFEKAATYMDENCEKNAILYIMSKKTREFGHPLEYAFMQLDRNMLLKMKEGYNEKYEKYDRCYYYISVAKEEAPEFLENKNVGETFFLGDMKIERWYPEDATKTVVPEVEEEKEKTIEDKIEANSRLEWGDLFK